ncbi:MAG: exo-alpha-sialidase [Cyclobacteriaceae bacterium]|nr:exo-alpha-sialidase [Cyclobacteriaceae bacterium]
MRKTSWLLVLVIAAACGSREKSAPVSLQWQPLPSPADSLTAEPYLTTDPSGRVFLSWIERGADTSRFLFSELHDTAWTSPAVIARGATWFINWADYPMVASDGASNRVAHLLDKSGEGKFAYDVKVFTSGDNGVTWRAPFILHDDGKEAEHGFVSLVPYEGKVFVTWLDGRNTAMEGMENMEGMDHSGHHGSMSLRAAIMDYSGQKIREWELDKKTCDCCQTTAAITENGPVVIYRDRSDEEIRDLSIVRWVNGAWTEPAPVHRDNWKIAGCPVNGPRVSVQGGQLAVAWFSAATDPAHVNVVFSSDNGASFGAPVSVDEGHAIGRVDIEWIDDHRVIVSWMEGTYIKAAVVHADGERETPVTIAESSEARSSGFPQITRTQHGLVVAWTDDKSRQVKTGLLKLN